ncbi:DUF1758 domain-containing protein [Trichonephila inaurata madagascariensis]|uniref:DUF1758 domain-containing protein n=1 Tax=Trichonephila inaurata madagascariensis TaxID=2747483 RepID=A0A8X7BZG7_9ARAC|nr:DUF1758 domain-containing protein [Trichonephila inaurata madagascariensis]
MGPRGPESARQTEAVIQITPLQQAAQINSNPTPIGKPIIPSGNNSDIKALLATTIQCLIQLLNAMNTAPTIANNFDKTRLQKILWKTSKTSTKIYELRTGTASVPYLATNILQQLALDEEKNFPLASKVLLQDFYMDDCLSGSSESTEFETLLLELKQLLQRGRRTLHKWCTNLSPTTAQEEYPLDRNSEEIQLTRKVISALKMQIESVQLWSDSTIILAWINIPPNQLKTFVGNRVSQIQQLFKDFQWKHISSDVNPADVLSRGQDVKRTCS